MTWQQFFVLLHLVGFALGVGGATVSDITFFKALRKMLITSEQLAFLETLSKIIWAGSIILILSGLAIFAIIYSEQNGLPMLSSPRWQTKLALVVIIVLNGINFKMAIMPALKNLVGQQLSLINIKPILGRLAFSGTLSILSWYSILLISQLPRTFRPSILYFFGVYLVMLIGGFIFSRLVITKILNKQ